MKKSVFILFFIFLTSCYQSPVEIRKEYLASESEGEIRHILKWKGTGYTLTIKRNKKTNDFNVDKSVGEICKKGDYFIKIKNTNKCILKRNDSLICLDCLSPDDKINDSISHIVNWKNYEKNTWRKIISACP